MNTQTEIIKPDAVSNDAGTATNVASTESVPAVADKPKSVKLELSEEEADIIQTLLNDYVLAYRSDRSVDYKPEPVPREKVGQYPYVATAPAPEIINPTYDWINKKWYSKNNSDSLPDLANTVTDLKVKNEQLYQDREKLDQDIKSVKAAQIANAQQSLMLTQAVTKMAESQNESEKLMTSIQAILVGIKATQDQKKATPIESKTNQK